MYTVLAMMCVGSGGLCTCVRVLSVCVCICVYIYIHMLCVCNCIDFHVETKFVCLVFMFQGL